MSLQVNKLLEHLLPVIWQTLAWFFELQWGNPVVSVISVDVYDHYLYERMSSTDRAVLLSCLATCPSILSDDLPFEAGCVSLMGMELVQGWKMERATTIQDVGE